MKHRLTRFGARGLLSLALLFLAPAAARTQQPNGAPSPGENLVFLAAGQPVVIRLHITLDGKPARQVRDEYVARWVAFYDRDGDGMLSREEAAGLPAPTTLQQMRNNPNLNPQQALRVAFAEIDADGDGKVTAAELARHFDRSGFTVLQMGVGVSRATSDPLSEALFRYLDVKKEGKLSRPGVVSVADSLLRRLDRDGDELLRPDELLAGVNLAGGGVVRPPAPGNPAVRAGGAFFLPRAGEEDATLGLVLLSTFDRDGDMALARAEVGLDAERFKQLDHNGDGKLDLDEASRVHLGPADLELSVRLVQGRGAPAVEVIGRRGKEVSLAGNGVRLALTDTQVTVQASAPGEPAARFNFQLQQLRALDVGRRGFVEMKDLQTPQARFLEPLLRLADRNGDGKLTFEEAGDFFTLMEEAPYAVFNIAATELGRGLFQLLDTNRDGLLGLRELRSAWDRLGPLDRDGDGWVGLDEVPRLFDVAVVQGPLQGAGRPQVARPVARGPLWFQRMDRNGDGDVSQREWLGPAEEFARIDADGDGLISSDEATAYDRKQRGPKR